MQYSSHNYIMTILILKTHFFPKTLHHVKKIFCQTMIYDYRRISDSDSTPRLPLKIEEIANEGGEQVHLSLKDLRIFIGRSEAQTAHRQRTTDY